MFFINFIQHCFICRPSVSVDARIEPRTVATSPLAVRRFNSTRLDLIHKVAILTVRKCRSTDFILPRYRRKVVGTVTPKSRWCIYTVVRHVTGNDKDFLR